MSNTPEIHVSSYFSPDDGVCVVHIDTPGITEDASGPVIRIYLNDEPIEQNPPYPGDPLSSPDNVHRLITEYISSLTIANGIYHKWQMLAPDGYIPASSYDEAINLLKIIKHVQWEKEEEEAIQELNDLRNR